MGSNNSERIADGERYLSSGWMSQSEPRLIVIGGPEAVACEAIPLDQLPIKLGRARENQVKLEHPLVSRVHCELFERDSRLFVRDLGSLNGTYVGSKRVELAELRPGDLLTIGIVTFRAIYGGFDFEASLEEQTWKAAEGIDILDTQPISGELTEKTFRFRSRDGSGPTSPQNSGS